MANHVSWLDILPRTASPHPFCRQNEIRRWPLIGTLVTAPARFTLIAATAATPPASTSTWPRPCRTATASGYSRKAPLRRTQPAAIQSLAVRRRRLRGAYPCSRDAALCQRRRQHQPGRQLCRRHHPCNPSATGLGAQPVVELHHGQPLSGEQPNPLWSCARMRNGRLRRGCSRGTSATSGQTEAATLEAANKTAKRK